MRVARWIAAAIVWGSRPLGDRSRRLVSFVGPIALVSVLGLWLAMLIFGAALVIRPSLDPAKDDFLSALYVAGANLSTIGQSSFTPSRAFDRFVFLICAVVGMSFIPLLVTYLMQLYSALLRRNSLALKIHALSEGKGDGAELLCGIGPDGRFENGSSVLGEIAGEMVAIKESHHFYPLLIYFRFVEPRYSVSRMAHVALDATTLMMSALAPELAWVQRSGTVILLWRSSIVLLEGLVSTLGHAPPEASAPRPEDRAVWRRRYAAALARLRAAGIPTVPDEAAGFDRYVELRARWDGLVHALAPALGFDMIEIDRPGARASPHPA
jgi:hypothetical protein